MIKQMLKAITPIHMRKMIRRFQYRLFGFENEFNGMDNSEIFNAVYREGMWGKTDSGISISGNGSHANEIITPYINKVISFLSEKKPSVIVDLGCGDFNVGRNFVSYADQYIACDVSTVILERNNEKFSSFDNVEFKLFDLSKDDLPKGDVCFVRQVLQHLSNDSILSFANKLNAHKPYKYLILTEGLPMQDAFKANLDKPSGKNTRFMFDSGVILHEPPFNLSYNTISHLLDVDSGDGKIKTLIYEL